MTLNFIGAEVMT